MDKFIKESDFNWLCLALKDECIENQYLELIHVIDGRAYATDGHRLHVAPCKLDDGVYCQHEMHHWNGLNPGRPKIADVDVPKGFNPRMTFIKQMNLAFNPTSQTTASDFYVQNGFYGQLVPKDSKSRFNRIYVLEATFGMSTKGETILHVHTKDDGENFMYANDGERSFVVMGLRLDREDGCEK